MKWLVITKNAETVYDLTELQKAADSLTSLSAGNGVIAGVTEDGSVLFAEESDEKASLFPGMMRRQQLHTRKWYDIWGDVSSFVFSSCYKDVALLLKQDGTCSLASVDSALSRYAENIGGDADRMKETVAGWRNVKQIAFNNAAFALHENGTVSCALLKKTYDHYRLGRLPAHPYEAVKEWRDVVKLVTGYQDHVVGIRSDGHILRAGDVREEGQNDYHAYLDEIIVRDFCFTGAESQTHIYIDKKGDLIRNERLLMSGSPVPFVELRSGFNYYAAVRNAEGTLCSALPHHGMSEGWHNVALYAVGSRKDPLEFFTVALIETGRPRS